MESFLVESFRRRLKDFRHVELAFVGGGGGVRVVGLGT
jgi:hypothetical protein